MSRHNAPGARANSFVFHASLIRRLVAQAATFLAATLVVAAVATHAEAQARAPNLLGSTALQVSHTSFDGRWAAVARDRPAVAGPAQQLVQRVKGLPALDRLQAVNAWVNHAVTYAGDPPGQDHWATLSETLTSGRGDCEDYAIAKLELLKAAGVPPQDLYLLIVRDLVRRADHAVLAVQVDGQFWILDLGTDEVLPQRAVHDYRPIMSFNAEHKWLHGFTSQLTVASAEGRSVAR